MAKRLRKVMAIYQASKATRKKQKLYFCRIRSPSPDVILIMSSVTETAITVGRWYEMTMPVTFIGIQI